MSNGSFRKSSGAVGGCGDAGGRASRLAPAAAAIVAVFVVSALGLPAAPLADQEGPPPAPVEVAVALERQMAPRLQVPGTVVSRHDARIAAEVAGQLTRVAEAGQTVARGEEIARVDDRALQLQLQDDEATIRRLEANLDYLDQQAARARRLNEQQILPAEQLEEATSRLAAAEQELIAARVRRERTLFALERTRLRAPFPGKVVERLEQPGGYVTVGQPVLRLVDVGDLEVRAQAPLAIEPFLREGMTVPVSDRQRTVEAPLRAVLRVGDERSRMFEVRIALAAAAGETPWIVGTPVRVALPTAPPRHVVSVPRDALVLRRQATYVYRVTAENVAERLDVETGVGDGELIEVSGAVAPGDRVVVRGGERLRPGQTVTVLGDDEPVPAAAASSSR